MSTTVPRARPRSRKQKELALKAQRRRTVRMFAAGTAAVVALLALAIVVNRGAIDNGPSTGETRPVTVTGESLPSFVEGSDPGVGLPIPEATGESFEGSGVDITLNGSPKMLLFLAHWCPHCQAEVPAVQAWIEEQGMPHGIEIISVATATDSAQPNYPPSAWLEREGWTAPILVDDASSSVGKAFGVTSYPFFVFVDSEGKVHHRAAGELPIEEIQGYLSVLNH